MNQKKKQLTTTLQKIGQKLEMTDQDVALATKTARSMIGMTIAAAIVLLIGKIITTQLDAIGLYYVGVSISDFGLLSRFF